MPAGTWPHLIPGKSFQDTIVDIYEYSKRVGTVTFDTFPGGVLDLDMRLPGCGVVPLKIHRQTYLHPKRLSFAAYVGFAGTGDGQNHRQGATRHYILRDHFSPFFHLHSANAPAYAA